MIEPIKLPPDLLAWTLVREGINKHRARDIECWMNEKMTQAVEQATTELRAECDALRAELDRLTTPRPASERRSTGLALWHFASGAATVSRKVQVGSIGWTLLPKVKQAKP